MPLITQAIPNFVQGVSQQPPAQRLAGQSEVQVNAYSDPVTGLRKRPPVTFGKNIRTDKLDFSADKVEIIRNDSNGKFSTVIHDGKLHVYNLETGLEANILTRTGNNTTGLPINTDDYLDTESESAETALFYLNVGSTTYIGNKRVAVATKNDRTDPADTTSYVYIKQGAADVGYQIILDHNDDGAAPPTQAAFSFSVVKYTTRERRVGAKNYWRLNGNTATITAGGTGYTTDREISCILRDPYSGATRKLSTSNGTLIVETGANGALTSVKTSLSINHTLFSNVRGNTPPPTEQITPPNDPNYSSTKITASYSSHTTNKLPVNGVDTYGQAVAKNSTDLIAEKLKDALIASSVVVAAEGTTLNSNHRFIASREGNMIKIRVRGDIGIVNSTFTYSITTNDSLANNGLQAIKEQVNSITDLPLVAFNNTKVKISGDEASEDDYYVEFETTNGANFGEGYWKETIGFDVLKSLDPETLPHVLKQVQYGDGGSTPDIFFFGHVQIEERLVGDDLSNPFPSFFQRRIENMFFFKNRLGFLSEDRVIMTEYGIGKELFGQLYYNFGKTTVQVLVDTDPIDVTVATDRSTDLKSAATFQDKLILFSDHTQFVLGGETQLTPRTISIVPVTNYDISSSVNPVTVGDAVYFATNQETSMTVREFILNEVTDTYTAFDVTAQVPNYIPTNVSYLAGTGTSSILAVASKSNRKELYIYKFLVVDSKKVLSSWSKFTFKHDIAAIAFEKDRLDIIFTHNGGTYNGVMDFDPTSKPSNHPFVPLLDCVVEKDYNATSGSVTLPFTASGLSASDFDVVSIDGSGEVTNLHTGNTKCTVANLSSTAISASSNDGNPAKCYIGMKYDMEYEFSEVIMKVESSHGDTPTNVPYKIRNISLYYTNVKGTEDKDDGHNIFDLKVTAPRIGDFSSDTKNYGFDTTLDPSDGFFKVPIYLDGNDVKLKLEHKSGYPVNFQNAEIEAITYARAKRY
jgi:hypothetical protein